MQICANYHPNSIYFTYVHELPLSYFQDEILIVINDICNGIICSKAGLAAS